VYFSFSPVASTKDIQVSIILSATSNFYSTMHRSQSTIPAALIAISIALATLLPSSHAHQASSHRWRRKGGGFFKPEAVHNWKATRGGSAYPHTIEGDQGYDQENESGQSQNNPASASKAGAGKDSSFTPGISSSTNRSSSQTSSPPAAQTPFLHSQNSSQNTNTNTNRIYPLSICSIQGKRQYMEDEYFTNQNGSFCSVFDGHGGSAVSKYLRQNLYARYLQAKATTMVSIMEGNEYDSDTDTDTDTDTNESGENLVSRQDDSSSDSEDTQMAGMSDPKKILSENLSKTNGIATPPSNLSVLSKPFDGMNSRSLKTCMRALRSAFEKIDAEVQRVSHWSFQGSTAVAVKLHKIASSKKTVLISANVGDSRAVLCRSGKAIDLTKDHKPNDPEERERVESLGGRVEWFGPVDAEGLPVSGKRRTKNGTSHGFSGVYRINRNLALSRAIGDRSELPFVSSQVDIQQIELDEENDQFLVLASDGLWDVFHDSQEAIDLCQSILLRSGNSANNEPNGTNLEKVRRKMSKVLVREALRRGSMDNITVVIIWLSP